jgi:hypothetical protein
MTRDYEVLAEENVSDDAAAPGITEAGRYFLPLTTMS